MTRALPVLLAVAACQPWYRDEVVRARGSRDARAISELADRGTHALAAGDASGAVDLLRESIARDPLGADGDTFVAYLSALVADHRRDEAIGAASWRWRRIGGTGVRRFLVDAYVADDRIAAALDLFGSLDEAAGDPALGPEVKPLADAANESDPARAIAAYVAWLDGYGVPDQELLVEARGRIVAAARALPAVSALLPRARTELAAGHVALALALYGHAWRVLPDEDFAPGWDELAAAARGADPDPDALQLAADSSAKAEAGELGAAIHLYRRAIARSPWWTLAHENLAALELADGRVALATAEQAIARRLGATDLVPLVVPAAPPTARPGPAPWALARADVDGQLRGAAFLAAGTLVFADRLQLAAGPLLGHTFGAFAGATMFVTRTLVRPTLSLGVPVFFSDGAHPGIEGSAGVRWALARRFALDATIGAAWFPTAGHGFDRVVFLPSLGIEIEL
jgi:hypothetical protein